MPLNLSKGTVFSAHVSDVALPDGFGVIRHEGFVVFVPFALPGDKITAAITATRKNHALARLLSVDEPSPDRVAPFCRHYGSCGGCSLQGLRYEKQLELKRRHVAEALRRIGGIDPGATSVKPAVASPCQTEYRGKIDLAFASQSGQAVVGMRQRVYGRGRTAGPVVPLLECPIFSAEAGRIMSTAGHWATKAHIPVYGPGRKNGFLKHLIVREAKSTQETMIVVEVSRTAEGHIRHLRDELPEKLPGLNSMYMATAGGPSEYRNFKAVTHLHGKEWITETIDDLNFRIYPQSFFQPNPGAAAQLYRMILAEAHLTGRESVLGLYSGTGCIELYLARHAASVEGVDSLPENVAVARANALDNGLSNCIFHGGPAETIFGNLKETFYGRIVVDPPRAGLAAEAIDGICRLGPPMVLYVSCNPATLARDLTIFLKQGYEVRHVTPFDFFPHTGHVEALASLVRNP